MKIMLCNLVGKPLVLSVFILALLSGSQISRASDLGRTQLGASKEEAKRNSYKVLRYLVPALNQAGKAGRIYFEESCPSDVDLLHPFPKIDAHRPSKDVSGLAAVQEIFKGDENVSVEENPAGIIRIRVGAMHNEVLQTKISHITFTPLEQYDDRKAINAIFGSQEMQAARQNLDTPISHPVAGHVMWPAEGYPHLPASLTNVTLDQSLDAVAQSFGGIVVFGICPSERWYDAYYTGGPGFDVRAEEGLRAENHCETMYKERLKEFDVSFGFNHTHFVSVSDSEGYFEVTGVVAYTDKAGNDRREEIECKIPGKP